MAKYPTNNELFISTAVRTTVYLISV